MAELLFVGSEDEALGKLSRWLSRAEPDWAIRQIREPASALEYLQRRPVDLVIASLSYGERSGTDDCERLFGNVLEVPLTSCLTSRQFETVGAEILRGVKRCAETCEEYRRCGSFFISQKHAEHGTFDATETLACRLEMKVMRRALDALHVDP